MGINHQKKKPHIKPTVEVESLLIIMQKKKAKKIQQTHDELKKIQESSERL